MANFIYDEKEEVFYLPDKEITYQDFFNKQVKSNLECNIEYKDKYIINLSKNSKVITFEDFDKVHKIFISNEDQVLYLIEYFCFDKYIVLKNGIDVQKIFNSLNFDTIKRVKNYLKKDEYLKEKKVITNPDIPLKLLSISYDKYQKYDSLSDNFELTDERKDFFNALKNLLNIKSFVAICGPKSIGKTTSLLYFKKKYLLNSFYINLSYCKKLFESNNMEELYLSLCKELFNCLNFDEANEVYSYLENNTYDSLMNMIFDLIKYLSEKYKTKKIYVIIDQYKEKIDPENKNIKQIKNLLKARSTFSIILCNSLNEKDFRDALQSYLKEPNISFINYLFVSRLAKVSNKKIDKLNPEEKKLLRECGDLYEYLYKIEKKKYEMTTDDIKEMIIKEIIEEIKDYYEEKDSTKIINKIKKLNLYIKTKIPYNQLSEIYALFPLKYFNISVDSKNCFEITDIKDNSKIEFTFSFPIVIDSLIRIFYDNKHLEKEKIINNIESQQNSLELEENFNEFLWITRFKNYYKGCRIKKMIEINSLIKMKDEDLEKYNFGLSFLIFKNESILITQKEPNAQYFDTGILKCLDKKGRIYELYLFQETIHKSSDERLCEILLKSLKYYFRLLFKTKLNIIIKDVFFSYVFRGEKIDKTTINYCVTNQINYMLYYENKTTIIDSNIDNKINSSFHYLQKPENKIIDTIELTSFDIDLKKNTKYNIEKEFQKLDNYLQKKRNKKKELLGTIKPKLDNSMKFDKIQFRKNNYQELLLDEELMENQPIIGISYQIDNNTKNLLKEINFNTTELNNFYELVKHFGNNLKILKVTKIDDIGANWVPSFRCAILAIDKKRNKIYLDNLNKKKYNLKNKEEIDSLDIYSDFYMIVFISSKMIA